MRWTIGSSWNVRKSCVLGPSHLGAWGSCGEAVLDMCKQVVDVRGCTMMYSMIAVDVMLRIRSMVPLWCGIAWCMMVWKDE